MKCKCGARGYAGHVKRVSGGEYPAHVFQLRASGPVRYDWNGERLPSGSAPAVDTSRELGALLLQHLDGSYPHLQA